MNLKLIGKLNNLNNEADILGPDNINLSIFSELYSCSLVILNGDILIDRDIDDTDKLIKLINSVEKLLDNKYSINARDIIALNEAIRENKEEELIKLFLKKENIISLSSGKPIYAKTLNQAYYLNALDKNDIIFAVGPAGTGKTFLGVCYAAKLLKTGKIKRIILVRPVVEAGEKLGFLPGDLKEKIDPYLVPLYDSLEDIFGKEHTEKLIDSGVIEVCPLAYMRGRTLDNACIILDEAQNTTTMQMKMFLTRLGFNSKMIVTGDISQIDLPNRIESGLIEATNLFNDIDGISIVKFQKSDVMRHPLVYKIVERYESER